MYNTEFYEVKFDMDTYDISNTANAPFYSFLGDRLYHPFNRLVYKDDFPILLSHIENENWEVFPIRLIAPNHSLVWCNTKIMDVSDNKCTMHFLPLDIAYDVVTNIKNSLFSYNYILESYDDEFFEYDDNRQIIEVFKIHRNKQLLFSGPIEDFERMLKNNTSNEEEKYEISNLINNIRLGNGFFTLDIKKNIIDDNPDMIHTLIKGASFTDDIGNIKSSGYIHLSSDMQYEIAASTQTDYLTGVLNKADITAKAIDYIDTKKLLNTTLVIIDVDHFKDVNDTYGHQAGDEVLRKVASIIDREAGSSSVVGRIGGDEFLVLFRGINNMEDYREYLRGIKNAIHIAFPADKKDVQPYVTLSIGCASYPKDAKNYSDLLTLADYALYLSKKKGRDRYIIYNEMLHDSLENIRNGKSSSFSINNRRASSKYEIVCDLMNKAYTDTNYTFNQFLDDIILDLEIERINVYKGTPYEFVKSCGNTITPVEQLKKTNVYINSPVYQELFDDKGCYVCNNNIYFKERDYDIYKQLTDNNIYSLIQYKAFDSNNTPVLISFEATRKTIGWHPELIMLLGLLSKVLSQFKID